MMPEINEYFAWSRSVKQRTDNVIVGSAVPLHRWASVILANALHSWITSAPPSPKRWYKLTFVLVIAFCAIGDELSEVLSEAIDM